MRRRIGWISTCHCHSGPLEPSFLRIYLLTAGPEAAILHLENTVDLTTHENTEVAMRILSDISNDEGEFYTDLNGFQVSADLNNK